MNETERIAWQTMRRRRCIRGTSKPGWLNVRDAEVSARKGSIVRFRISCTSICFLQPNAPKMICVQKSDFFAITQEIARAPDGSDLHVLGSRPTAEPRKSAKPVSGRK